MTLTCFPASESTKSDKWVVVTTTRGNLLSLTGFSAQLPIESMAIAQEAFHPKELGEKKFLMWVVKEFTLTNQSMEMIFLESMQ